MRHDTLSPHLYPAGFLGYSTPPGAHSWVQLSSDPGSSEHEAFETADLPANAEDDKGVARADGILGRGCGVELVFGAPDGEDCCARLLPIFNWPMVWFARGEFAGTVNSSRRNSMPFLLRGTMSKKSTSGCRNQGYAGASGAPYFATNPKRIAATERTIAVAPSRRAWRA